MPMSQGQGAVSLAVRLTFQAVLDISCASRLFVLGLLCTDLGGRRMQGPSISTQVAVQQLQPFLGSHADHFWHEVLCFGASDHSLTTYDRIAVYTQQPGPQVWTVEQLSAQCLRCIAALHALYPVGMRYHSSQSGLQCITSSQLHWVRWQLSTQGWHAS